MRKRRKTTEDQLIRERIHLSARLSEVAPQVKRIEINLQFADDGDIAFQRPRLDAQICGPQSASVFYFKCDNRECVHGGHDISAAIWNAINERGPDARGEHVCDGWQDRERVGQYRCLCRLRYVADVTYFDPT